MNEITFDLNKISLFFKRFYLLLILSLMINLMLLVLIYNSNLMEEIDYRTAHVDIYFEKDELTNIQYANKITTYSPRCGDDIFFPPIYDFNNYNNVDAIEDFEKLIANKLDKQNNYSAKNQEVNFFVNIINLKQSKFDFIPLRDKFVFSKFPDSQIRFNKDFNLSLGNNNYILSFFVDYKVKELSDNDIIIIHDAVLNYFNEVYQSLFAKRVYQNINFVKVAEQFTISYIDDIQSIDGYNEDSKLVYCVLKNKINLRQIKNLKNVKNADSNVSFVSEMRYTNKKLTPKVDENLAIYSIPILFFGLTFLYCLYRNRAEKR